MCAHETGQYQRPLVLGAARPPVAWLALLGREPRLMQRGVAPRSLELTPEVSERLRFVQDDVNASIRYAPDAAGRDRWGVLGWRRVWGLDGRRWLRVGDCDDYAVEKLRRLLGLDFGGCARLVVCRVLFAASGVAQACGVGHRGATRS